jgi:hypothetical protein
MKISSEPFHNLKISIKFYNSETHFLFFLFFVIIALFYNSKAETFSNFLHTIHLFAIISDNSLKSWRLMSNSGASFFLGTEPKRPVLFSASIPFAALSLSPPQGSSFAFLSVLRTCGQHRD